MSQILKPSDRQVTEHLAGDVVDRYMKSAAPLEVRTDDDATTFDTSLRGTDKPGCGK